MYVRCIFIVYIFQVVWTLSQAAVAMAASALTCVAVCVRKAGQAKTARSPAALMTAQARGFALTGSVCVTATLEERTVQSRGALQTALVGACVSTASVCARSPSPGKTAQSEGV